MSKLKLIGRFLFIPDWREKATFTARTHFNQIEKLQMHNYNPFGDFIALNCQLTS